jgi:low affinity Fe/Cu permease
MAQKNLFMRMANAASRFAGSPVSFVLALLVVVTWLASGPLFKFSDTWQLVINTGTTIVTFLMVFLIQNSQNRDSRALQIKLDELIRATRGAHNKLLDLEELEESDLKAFQDRYEDLAKRARECASQDEEDIGSPEVDEPRRRTQSE